MTRTEAEAWLEANTYSWSRKYKADNSGVAQPIQASGAGWEYSYVVVFSLDDKCTPPSDVKLFSKGQNAEDESIWENGEPKNPLKSSITSYEGQIKQWCSNPAHIPGFRALGVISKSSLGSFPQWAIVPCVVDDNGVTVTKKFFVEQSEEGGQVTATEYVEA